MAEPANNSAPAETPGQQNAPSPAPTAPASSSPSDMAEYNEYLQTFAKKNETPAAPTVQKVGKNGYVATTPMARTVTTEPAAAPTATPASPNAATPPPTSEQPAEGKPVTAPAEPVRIGGKPDQKTEPVTVNKVSGDGASKEGKNKLQLKKGVEFTVPAPLSYDDWKALKTARTHAAKNDGGYQDYLDNVREANDMAADSGRDTVDPMPYEDWLAAQEPQPVAPGASAPATPPQAAPAPVPGPTAENQPPDIAPEGAPLLLDQTQTAPESEDEEPESETPTGSEPADELADTTDTTEPADEEVSDEPTEGVTPTPETDTQPKTPQIAPADQAARAQQLAASKAKDKKNAVANQNQPEENKNKPKQPFLKGLANNLKPQAKKLANQFNPMEQARNLKNNAINNINQKAAPFKRFANIRKLRELKKQRKKLQDDESKLIKKLKVPERKLRRLNWLRRSYRSRKAFYGFLIFAYFATVLPLLLLIIGIGEGILGMLIKGYVRAATQLKMLGPEIKMVEASMADDKGKVEKIENEKKSIARKEVALSQLIPTGQKPANDNGEVQNTNTASPASAAGTPWNDPNFDKNAIANDNSQNDAQKAA